MEVLQSKPDGFALLSDADGSNCILEAWGTDIPFKVEDRSYICKITILPLVFVVAKDTGWTSLDDVANAVKEDPASVTFAWSGGTGGIDCQTAQFLRAMEDRGIDTSLINMVTYSSGSDVATAVAGGHADIGGVSPTSGKSVHDAGLVDMISITTEERSPQHPTVATTREQGWNSVNFVGHTGLSGPAGMPEEVVKIIADQVAEIVKLPDVIAEFENLGLAVDFLGPEDYRANVMELTAELKRIQVS